MKNKAKGNGTKEDLCLQGNQIRLQMSKQSDIVVLN